MMERVVEVEQQELKCWWLPRGTEEAYESRESIGQEPWGSAQDWGLHVDMERRNRSEGRFSVPIGPSG